MIDLQLTNPGNVAALATKATLKNAQTVERILPAYFSDNYISILPGETKGVTVRISRREGPQSNFIALRGWNVSEDTIEVH